MKKLLFMILCVACSLLCTLLAQDRYKLQGYLLAKNDSIALADAIVRAELDEQKSAIAIVSYHGYFELTMPSVPRRLSLSYKGREYPLELSAFKSPQQRVLVDIDTRIAFLDEVEVTAERAKLRYDGSKAIYNLGAFEGIRGADVLEGLKRIPNLQHSSGQGFLLNGFEKITVLIDKRPLRMSMGELEAYLANMPTADVASVELIPNPSPDYGTGGQPVLNVVTKRHIEDGYNAFATARLTAQHYLSEQVGARVNINRGISRSYLTYNFGEARSRETTELVGISTQHSVVRPRRTHSLGLGTLLRLTERQSLDINLYGAWQTEKYSYGSGDTSQLKRPRLSASLQHIYKRHNFEVRTTLEGAWARLNQATTLGLPVDLRDRTSFYRFSPTFVYRPSNASSLVGGLSYEGTSYRNEYLRSASSFDYDERQATAFVGYNQNLGDFSLQSTVEARWYDMRTRQISDVNKSDELVWLPRLMLGYKLAKNHLLTLDLRSRQTRPNFRDLTPISTQTGALWTREGNSSLHSARAYDVALRYSFMQAAQLELSYSDTKHPIVEYLSESRPNALAIGKTNLDYSRYLRALAVIPLPLARSKALSWTATTTGAVQHQWDKGAVSGRMYDERFTTYYLQHRHDLTLSSSWTLALSATLYGPLRYGVYAMKSTWWGELSVSKRLRAWRITASVRDPWNTNTARGAFEGLSRSLSFVRSWHRPEVSLSLSYSLGNGKLNGYRTRSGTDGTARMRSEGNEGFARGVGL